MATQFSISEGKAWKVPFFTIWSGQAISILGSQLVQFALIWHLTVSTGSATVLATATIVGLLPQIILGPLVGTLVDRWDRRWIMLLSDCLIAAATIVLAVLFSLGQATTGSIYWVMFIRALAGVFHSNAMTASTSLMVPVENLTRIQGVNQMLNGGLNVVSAPLGALLIEVLPLQAVLALDVGSAMLAILPLLVIAIPQPARIESRQLLQQLQTSIWDDMRAGLRYVLAWPGLLILGGMAVMINILVLPAMSLLPLLVQGHFGGGAIQLGWVEAAIGVGVISGGGLLGIWGGFKRKILTSLAGLIGAGMGCLILALAPPEGIRLAIVGGMLMGMTIPMINGPIFAVLQATVEPEMQARIFALVISVASGMAPIGLLAAGPLAERAGIQAWFLLGAVACVLMGIAGLLIPAVMNIEEARRPLTVLAVE